MSSQPLDMKAEFERLSAPAGLPCVKAARSKDAVVVPQPDRHGEFECPADGAKFMAAQGIPQTPLKGKNPDIGGTGWHLRASTDFAQIDEWARIYPGCNFGSVAFAEIGKHFVLEADSPEVRKRHQADTNTDFPKTLTIQSREGRGHRWYLQTAESIALGNISQDNRFGDFSLRMQHEQAVSPGSIHPDTGKQYRVVVNMPPSVMLPADINWLGTQKKLRTKIDRSLTGKKIPYGQHDSTLFGIACNLREMGLEEQGINACLVEVCENRCEGYGEDYLEMCAKKATSACKYPPGTDKAAIFKNSAYGVPPFKMAKPSNTNAPMLEFRFPKAEGGPLDFVCEPLSGEMDGWFPLGSPSLIAGSSGTNKSTLMMQLLQAQRYNEPFLGHETKGRSYLIIMLDRGAYSHERTMIRMHLTDEVIPIEYMETKIGIEGVQEIVRKIEETVPMPQVVFIEGADMIVEESNDKRIVAEFLGLLQQVATRYHIAIVLSVGSPKSKAGEGYIGKRDNVSGTEAWSRLSETVMLLQYPKGKDTVTVRELTVLPRNAKSESFTLVLERGRLRLQTDADREKQLLVDDPALAWVREQACLAETDSTKKWWTVLQLRRATKMKRTAAKEWVNEAHDDTHWIIKKTGTGNKGRGKAALYAWNPSASTNSLLADQKTSDSEGDILIECSEQGGD